ncbi:hypothetical protein GLAREA_06304 [Glarea lozoyensis ATCC 20868]|uniref:Uncharacterized protein n=1 Tax=Glarea lozoyensis (strain ATCC 20868 / MF5171) TaxID=1116229 RepID=S3D4D9_GLAL2|nr:uncharacterized protein GLAREA_06304 [Glarea lozoyensis ATCC 20868]EPE33292.1 hypothetical protein GLAREA_06304 [Glarea lozoyensis ATCC 20868]
MGRLSSESIIGLLALLVNLAPLVFLLITWMRRRSRDWPCNAVFEEVWFCQNRKCFMLQTIRRFPEAVQEELIFGSMQSSHRAPTIRGRTRRQETDEMAHPM